MESNMLPKRLLILSAILEEHKVMRKLLTSPKTVKKSAHHQLEGAIGDVVVDIAMTSMGMDAAQKAAEALINKDKYFGVLVTGYCGGLSVPLKIGDVVIPLRVIPTPAGEFSFEMDGALVEKLGKAVISLGHKYRAVPLITVPKVIETPHEKEELFRSTFAEAVDMETAEVIRIARQREVPVLGLKIVIDDCEQELPDYNSHFEKTGRMDHLNLASAFVAHPMLAMKLSKNMKHAGGVLGEILPAVVSTVAKHWNGGSRR